MKQNWSKHFIPFSCSKATYTTATKSYYGTTTSNENNSIIGIIIIIILVTINLNFYFKATVIIFHTYYNALRQVK